MYSSEVPSLTDRADKPTQLPWPSGHKLLIALPQVEEKTDGGVYRPESLIKAEETASILGFVLKLGPDAYKDPARFPTGPWCKVGDMIIFRPYSGTRLNIHGQEFRIINDDTVDGVVDDPRGFRRA